MPLIVLSVATSGCVTERYFDSRVVQEKLKLEKVLIAKDGTTALETRHSCFRYKMALVRDHGPETGVKEQDRRRYIILSAQLMDAIYKTLQGEQTDNVLLSKAGVAVRRESVVDPRSHVYTNSGEWEIFIDVSDHTDQSSGKNLIPTEFLDPDTTPDSLPEIFHSQPYLTLDPEDDPTYTNQGVERQMHFSRWKPRSFRSHDMPGRYKMVPLTILGDVSFGVVTYPLVVVGAAISIVSYATVIPFYYYAPRITGGFSSLNDRIHPLPTELPQPPLPSAASLKTGTEYALDLGPGIKIEMVWIPSGNFIMGSEENESDRRKDESPLHPVELDGFWLGKHEVTQQQYRRILGAKFGRFHGSGRLPADTVRWNDAAQFCARLSVLTNQHCALPTEARWEYACRAGTTTRFFFGNEHRLSEFAWTVEDSKNKPHKVGQLKPNPWGLYDLYGNVNEWCADWYDPAFYQNFPAKNPMARAEGQGHVFRGGSYMTIGAGIRSARRDHGNETDRLWGQGFRICIIPQSELQDSPLEPKGASPNPPPKSDKGDGVF